MRAVVLFGDTGAGPFAPFLAKGFRHCELAVEVVPPRLEDGRVVAPGTWVGLAGGSGGVKIQAWPPRLGPMAYAERQGLTAVSATVRHYRGYQLVGFVDCVGTAKAILGIRDWRIRTPWQLHRHLTREAA